VFVVVVCCCFLLTSFFFRHDVGVWVRSQARVSVRRVNGLGCFCGGCGVGLAKKMKRCVVMAMMALASGLYL
jgi:hypothetical protein